MIVVVVMIMTDSGGGGCGVVTDGGDGSYLSYLGTSISN